jgi:hypothetical protein
LVIEGSRTIPSSGIRIGNLIQLANELQSRRIDLESLTEKTAELGISESIPLMEVCV